MKKGNQIKKYTHFIYLLFCIVIVLIGKSFLGESIKYPFSYIFSPVYALGSKTGQSVSNWRNALVDASSYIEEYNEMKEEIARLKVENSEKLIDYAEYISLKEHSAILKSGGSYVESEILSYKDTGEVIINKGSEDGVKKGDIVVIGRVFIGVVSNVELKSALVRLPINSSSSFEVVIVPSTVDLNKESRVDSLVKSKGVVIGDVESIVIENMGINSSVLDGDYVLLRDERVGQILILGTLIGVSKDPASTHKTGFVSPIFDYNSILNVFVKVE